MLETVDAAANLAVKDMGVARRFYEDTLGLSKVGSEGDDLVVYRSGKTTLNVYKSKEAGTNRATAVTWAVGDGFERVMRALKDKGVKFERYEIPGLSRDGDVHSGSDMKVAWFKDPDGNILNIVSR